MFAANAELIEHKSVRLRQVCNEHARFKRWQKRVKIFSFGADLRKCRLLVQNLNQTDFKVDLGIRDNLGFGFYELNSRVVLELLADGGFEILGI